MPSVAASMRLEDHADDHLVGHEVAAVHELLGLPAELGALLDRGAQHVARGDVGQAEVLVQALGLGALAGPGRAEEDEIQLGQE